MQLLLRLHSVCVKYILLPGNKFVKYNYMYSFLRLPLALSIWPVLLLSHVVHTLIIQLSQAYIIICTGLRSENNNLFSFIAKILLALHFTIHTLIRYLKSTFRKCIGVSPI